MKELIDKYNEFKSNRRRVGATKLGFWVIFFTVIILFCLTPRGGGSSSSSTPIKDNNDDKKDAEIIANYNFDYTINNVIYKGTYDNNIIELIGDDASFYITNENKFADKENAILPNYEYVNINAFNDFKNISELEYQTSYKDGKEEYKYINKLNDTETNITYIENTDDTIDVFISNEYNLIEIHYYNFSKAELKIDLDKYTYEIKEVENEY